MLFESAPIGLAFLDRDLRFVRINSVLAEINGLPPEAHIGRKVQEVLPELPIEQFEAHWRRILETGEPMLDVEVSGATPAAHGKRRYWLEDWYPLRAAGRIIGIGAVVREITAQKEAQAALRRQADLLARDREAAERRLTYLASFPERNPNPILELGADGCVRYANPVMRQLFPDVHEGGQVPPCLAEWESLARSVLETGASPAIDVVTVGDLCYQLSFSHVLEDGVVRIYGLDVTERARAEAALRESEARFRTVTENAPDTIARFDRGLRHLFVNPAVVRATGIPAEDFLGRTKRELGMPADHVALWDESVRRVFDTAAPCNIEFSFAGPRGVAYYEARLVPELTPDGCVGSVLAMTRDVTEARRAGEELVRARLEAERRAREAEEAERALRASREQLRALVARVNSIREEEKERIARDLHDEVGQILTALRMQLESLEDGLGDLPAEGAIPALLDRAVAASELVGKVIDSMHHLVASLRPVALDRLGLGSALRQECRSFQEWAGVACDVVAAEDLATFGPEIDTALFRIAQEALTNVARHARASRATVSLEAPPGAVILRIADDGSGIRHGGAQGGLGLLGMRERAERLGGELVVEPGACGGTVVAVRIPLAGGRGATDGA